MPILLSKAARQAGRQRIQQPRCRHLPSDQEEQTVAGVQAVGLRCRDPGADQCPVDQIVKPGAQVSPDRIRPLRAVEALDVDPEDSPMGRFVQHHLTA